MHAGCLEHVKPGVQFKAPFMGCIYGILKRIDPGILVPRIVSPGLVRRFVVSGTALPDLEKYSGHVSSGMIVHYLIDPGHYFSRTMGWTNILPSYNPRGTKFPVQWHCIDQCRQSKDSYNLLVYLSHYWLAQIILGLKNLYH